MIKNSLMICSNVSNPLATKLNESEGSGHKYILQGVFAELGKKNRNERIYTKDEYLRHLQYLRNDIKSGEPLLGELDHPDDRFEVKLKEASHRIVDLWYDDQNNVVMGKIELLDTPNGKIAQSMVEQGIPLHISSRAAGTVNNDHTVSIQQIYTYDLVAKPGFAGAILHRVDESANEPVYSNEVKSVLGRMEHNESLNEAAQYGFLNEDMSISDVKATAVLRKEAKELQINRETEIDTNMNKPLTEQDNLDPTQAFNASVPNATVDEGNGDNGDAQDDDKDKDTKDGEGNDGGDSGEDNGNKDGDDGVKITGIEPIFSDDDDKDGDDKDTDIKGIEPDKDGDDKDKDGEGDSSDDNSNEENERSATGEATDKNKLFDDKIFDDDDEDGAAADGAEGGDDNKSEEDKKKEEEEAKKAEEEKKKADEKAEEESKKLGDRVEKFGEMMDKKMNDIKDILEKQKGEKKDECSESVIMAQYPVTMMMNESNFAAFAALSESQKNKVISYLQETKCVTREAINENWKKGIDYENETPVWLKFAPESYRSLYESAAESVKKNLALQAKYFVFESQSDINTFWENSGLDAYAARQLLNESFVNNMPKVTPAPKHVDLPYSEEYIKMIGDMASEYN